MNKTNLFNNHLFLFVFLALSFIFNCTYPMVENLDKETILEAENSHLKRFLSLPLQFYRHLQVSGFQEYDIDLIENFLARNKQFRELHSAIYSDTVPKGWDLYWVTIILDSFYDQIKNNQLTAEYLAWKQDTLDIKTPNNSPVSPLTMLKPSPPSQECPEMSKQLTPIPTPEPSPIKLTLSFTKKKMPKVKPFK